MGQLIGLLNETWDYNISKKDLLFFDRIAIPDLGCRMDMLKSANKRYGTLQEKCANIDFLVEKELIIEPPSTDGRPFLQMGGDPPILSDADETAISAHKEYLNLVVTNKGGSGKLEVPDVEEISRWLALYQIKMRNLCVRLCQQEGTHAVLMMPLSHFLIGSSLTKKAQIVQIVLKTIPFPDESTSYEKILDFRSDPDTHGKQLGLRNWITDVARLDITPSEIADKLEWMMYDYSQHLQIHKMKSNIGTIETIVTVTAEILENLVRLRWGKLAKKLFSIRQRKVNLLEAELKSPGREISYLLKVKNTFRKRT